MDISMLKDLGEVVSFMTVPFRRKYRKRVKDADVVVINRLAMNGESLGNAKRLDRLPLPPPNQYDRLGLCECQRNPSVQCEGVLYQCGGTAYVRPGSGADP